MGVLEILLIAIGLAMDAFAVAICKSPCIGAQEAYKKFMMPFLFGVFQMMMPIIGWLIGDQFAATISAYDHWIIFILLGYLGVNMIRASRETNTDESCTYLTWQEMSALAVATSIDAMAIGITFAFLNVNVWGASAVIGAVAFLISLVGVYIGKQLGNLLKERAELLGGIVLIFIGVKILLEHLGILVL